jgi:hypothetical protein
MKEHEEKYGCSFSTAITTNSDSARIKMSSRSYQRNMTHPIVPGESMLG